MAVLLLLALSSISTWHRRSTGWHWHGANPKQRLAALGSLGLTAVFLCAGTPLFPPFNPRFLPWYLAGLGIGLFSFLQSLRFVHTSEAAFLADCVESAGQLPEPAQVEPSSPQWQEAVKTVFRVVFFIVWLEFLIFFYYSGKTFRDGSPVPTQTQTEPVSDHGKTVYIRADQKGLRDKLELFVIVGIPSVIATGFLLNFVLGIKVFDKRQA